MWEAGRRTLRAAALFCLGFLLTVLLFSMSAWAQDCTENDKNKILDPTIRNTFEYFILEASGGHGYRVVIFVNANFPNRQASDPKFDPRYTQRAYVFADIDSESGTRLPQLELRHLWTSKISAGDGKAKLNGKDEPVDRITPKGYFPIKAGLKLVHESSEYYVDEAKTEPVKLEHWIPFITVLQSNPQKGGIGFHAAQADKIRRLGQADSAGCVRLPPVCAQKLYSLVSSPDLFGESEEITEDPIDGGMFLGKFRKDAPKALVIVY